MFSELSSWFDVVSVVLVVVASVTSEDSLVASVDVDVVCTSALSVAA